jgi:hypothetical protein
MRRFNYIASTLLIVLLMVIGCVVLYYLSIALFGFDLVPDSALNPPLYPGAANVNIGESTLYPRVSNVYFTKQISYEVEAKPETILAFYQTQFDNDDWYNPVIAGKSGADNVFEWHQAGPDGPTNTAFRTTIGMEVLEDKRTKVTLDIWRFDPR